MLLPFVEPEPPEFDRQRVVDIKVSIKLLEKDIVEALGDRLPPLLEEAFENISYDLSELHSLIGQEID